MSLISELREIIKESLKHNEVVSGIEIMGRFDWQWHAIPTLNEFQRAVEKIDGLQLSKDDEGILQFSLSADNSALNCEIVENDVQLIYNAYKQRAKKK